MLHVGDDVYVVIDDRGQVCSVHETWGNAFDRCVDLGCKFGKTYSIVHRLLKE